MLATSISTNKIEDTKRGGNGLYKMVRSPTPTGTIMNDDNTKKMSQLTGVATDAFHMMTGGHFQKCQPWY